jgi:outer membrane putative beta-barrel porin/alpha-amylase
VSCRVVAAAFLLLFGGALASAQNAKSESYLAGWFDRVTRTQAMQPHWITPIFTTTPRLEEEFRYDIGRQNTARGDVTNYGGGKGLELIPTERTEIIFGLPPYISHSSPLAHDGFGDTVFLLKYRIATANEHSGNYIVTAFLGGSIPTGSYTNGARDATVTPTIAFGKGWGNFDFQTTLGAAIPVHDESRSGTPIAHNLAFQYHVLKKLWPEVELNSTFFHGGDHAGEKQVFVSPGLVAGRFHLWRRLSLTLGAGIQIAATHFHTFNHNRVITVRFPF